MSFFDVNQNLHDTSIDIILNITWTNQYLLTSLTKDIHINIACERQTFLLAHHHWGTFREEEPLPLSDRNSILMTKINVYIINPVVMGFQNANLLNFTFLLVDFGKVLCSSANELQQNSNASSREDYIPQILTVLLQIHRFYIWPLRPFVFCLSFVNNS